MLKSSLEKSLLPNHFSFDRNSQKRLETMGFEPFFCALLREEYPVDPSMGSDLCQIIGGLSSFSVHQHYAFFF